jgi:hypothetical protein
MWIVVHKIFKYQDVCHNTFDVLPLKSTNMANFSDICLLYNVINHRLFNRFSTKYRIKISFDMLRTTWTLLKTSLEICSDLFMHLILLLIIFPFSFWNWTFWFFVSFHIVCLIWHSFLLSNNELKVIKDSDPQLFLSQPQQHHGAWFTQLSLHF